MYTLCWTLLVPLVFVAPAYAQSSPKFPVIDLGYTRHAPTYVNLTTLHNISYATYANIRFAQPPLGDLRFRAPKMPPPFNDTIQDGSYPQYATDCLHSIPSYLEFAPGVNGTSWGSEDCLFLDVKVPEGVAEGDNVPVLHWLYGGGYVFGSKDWAGNPAGMFQDIMPDEKFITVSSNYRLGALGWMSSEGTDITPNVGLWDGLAALEWTQQYISRFGGDPNLITAIGESAGGAIIQHLITARGGSGTVPFKQAIMTSPGYRPHVNRSQEMTEIYNLFLEAANCTDTSCLRDASPEVIVAANRDLLLSVDSSGWLGPSIGYGPIIDGDLVLDVPDRLLGQGKYHRGVEKVLVANMANDGVAAVVTQRTLTSWHDFLKVYMRSPTDNAIARIKATYSNATGDAWDTFNKDAIFACHAHLTAKAYAGNSYRYEMSIPPASHGQDQFYYLYVDGWAEPAEFPQIAKRMQKYFRNFVLHGETGDQKPNREGEVLIPTIWPPYGEGQVWMNITNTTHSGFEVVHGEAEQAKRCNLLLELMDDPANGF